MADRNEPNAQGAEQANAGGMNFRSILYVGFMVFMVMNAMNKNVANVKDSSAVQSEARDTLEHAARKTPSRSTTVPVRSAVPLARPGDSFSIRVEVSNHLFPPIHFNHLRFDHQFLSDQHLNTTVQLDLASCAANNCTADILVTWTLRGKTFSTSEPLIRFYGSKRVEKHRLIGSDAKKSGDSGAEREAGAEVAASSGEDSVVYRAYIQPSVKISPVVDFTAPLPPPFAEFTTVDESTMQYGPVVYINNFWVLRDHLREVNKSTASQLFDLSVTVEPLSAWKMAMYHQYDQTMKSQEEVGLMTADSSEEVKRIFLETNPYFLALTALVTILHIVFEYLAFANDIKFWRGKKDFKGLSLRSVAMNCYFQTVIFLYLVDSNETSWSVLLPSGLGVLSEYWKLTQCVAFTKDGGKRGSPEGVKTDAPQDKSGEDGIVLRAFGYQVQFSDSYDKRTRKHDDTAIRWLLYTMIPILFGYSIYSLVYNEHRSWYSFVIHTQVQFIYFFGFAMMTPQIFINYKLKSVGQLPWRTFVYKALNTVIDDLFAFIIKMPWLHRIACFRDDVVFVILLYQRWIYPVDMSRMADEDDDGDSAADADAVKEGTEEQQALLDADAQQAKKQQ